VGVNRRAQQRVRAAAVAFASVSPRASGALRASLLQALAPSRRSLVAGAALLAAAGALYGVARGTSAFAVRRVVVDGAPPAVARQVRHALAPFVGTSLVGLDGSALERRLEALPTVVDAGYDRSFPHTLHVTVLPEHAAAVVRSGKATWLVSARGRLVTRTGRHEQPALARIWLPASAPLVAGGFLPRWRGGRTAEALGLAAGFPYRIRTASLTRDGLVFELAAGYELRLGAANDIRLKLAVARRALPVLPEGTTYLDLSVPERPVAGSDGGTTDPKVSSGA
jgi:POTRA domain, FtsQ-type